MKGGVITDAQFDALSKENVLHWVSAHIIAVSIQRLSRFASDGIDSAYARNHRSLLFRASLMIPCFPKSR